MDKIIYYDYAFSFPNNFHQFLIKLIYLGNMTNVQIHLYTNDSFEKTLMLGKIEGGRRRGRQRMDEMVGWHH